MIKGGDVGTDDSRSGIRIRTATKADARLLTDLGAHLFQQTFGPANSAENMEMYLAGAFSDSMQSAELSDANRTAWIAFDDAGAAIGYAMARRGSRADGVVFRRPMELQRIYVDAKWHGAGVGQMLMNVCIDAARSRQCDGVWLCVWQSNARAVAFYTRVGFRVVGAATFPLGRDLQADHVMALAF
ncbi:MAG TPA: GNAT family N-acetyltransferase [Gemmatimonadaceae bacterium]|jgi:ribosomal protein S18 acetylase RimI-like enzyme|nr:GNAT family N-acetyltransferase [Gemmatimonadaceae bacterium]